MKNIVSRNIYHLTYRKALSGLIVTSSLFLCAFSPSNAIQLQNNGSKTFFLINNQKTPAATKQKKAVPKVLPIKVGFVTNELGLSDNGLNESANNGFKKAVKDFKIKYKAIRSVSINSYLSNFSLLAKNNYDLIFGLGFPMADSIERAAEKYPSKKFCIIDTSVQLPNVQSIIFKEEEGSFLMGIIAGKYTKTNKVGFIGSMNFPIINKYEAGFIAGVKAVNPIAAEGLISKKTSVYAGSADNFEKGYSLAKDLYDDDCDIIYEAAGDTGIGVLDAAEDIKRCNKTTWVIGSDTDLALSYPEYSNIILSCMIKNINTAVYSVIKAKQHNKFDGGKILSLGIKDGGVGVSPNSLKKLPKDIIALLNKYTSLIKAKKITIPYVSTDAAKYNEN